MAKKKALLTDKQRHFCLAYIENGGNAKKAYEEAYNTSNMQPSTIYRKAYELLSNARVSAEINRLRGELKKRWQLRIDRVLEELAYIATVDPEEIFNNDWSPKPMNEIPEHARRAIAAIKRKQTLGDDAENMVELKLWDKTVALEKFMKHFGAYEKDNEQKVTQITVKVEE